MNIESKELRMFSQYCRTRGLKVENFEERNPPEPDIYASVMGDGVAFELTEAIEPGYARKLAELSKTPELIRRSYSALSSAKKKLLEANHYGKVIDVCFFDEIPSREREVSLPIIFDFLISIPADFGSYELERIEKPKVDLLNYISLQQINWEGIHWEAGTSYVRVDPEAALVDRLIDKMENKQYESAWPMELIVYLDKEADPPPGSGWVERLADVASSRITESPFRAVWLLNMLSFSVCILAGSSSQ